jgi:hypothetical protein
MGRAGFEPALLYQELGPKPSAYANFATCPWLQQFASIQIDRTSDRIKLIFEAFIVL